MIDTAKEYLPALDKGSEVARNLADKIFAAARPGAVFGEPVRAGDYTLITASEVTAAGGFGFGGGGGTSPAAPARAGATDAVDTGAPPAGGGGGAGGGGTSLARPVATIVIGPDGVKVQPIIDPTKIAIAAITAWGAMAVMLMRLSRARRS